MQADICLVWPHMQALTCVILLTYRYSYFQHYKHTANVMNDAYLYTFTSVWMQLNMCKLFWFRTMVRIIFQWTLLCCSLITETYTGRSIKSAPSFWVTKASARFTSLLVAYLIAGAYPLTGLPSPLLIASSWAIWFKCWTIKEIGLFWVIYAASAFNWIWTRTTSNSAIFTSDSGKIFTRTSDAYFMVINVRAVTPPLTSSICSGIAVIRSMDASSTIHSWWGRWMLNTTIFTSSVVTLTSCLTSGWVNRVIKPSSIRFNACYTFMIDLNLLAF